MTIIKRLKIVNEYSKQRWIFRNYFFKFWANENEHKAIGRHVRCKKGARTKNLRI